MKMTPIKRLMYMGIRRRPRATTCAYEAFSYAVEMTAYAAATRGGRWKTVPVQVIELPNDGKYTEEGERAK